MCYEKNTIEPDNFYVGILNTNRIIYSYIEMSIQNYEWDAAK